MNNRQNVPGIARGPQSFSPRSLPPVPNPMGQPPAMQQQDDGVSVQDELAMEIYCRLAFANISNQDVGEPADASQLRELAKDARIAAQAFFEENPNNG